MQVMNYPPKHAYAGVRPAATQEQATPYVADVVLYVLPEGPNAGEVRPAIIVRTWGAMIVNLQVFIDGANDYPAMSSDMLWRTSVHYSEAGDLGTWHFKEAQ